MVQRGGLITVIGGSGFIGRHTIRILARDGWRIKAATRRPELAGYLQPMGDVGQIYPVQANLRFPESIHHVLTGADAAVNLVGILFNSGAQTFKNIHVEGARNAARAAREAGVKTFIHVSALGASPNSKGRYGRTKAAGEAAVLAEFPDAVILRPSIVFGPEDHFFNRFAALAQFSPLLPLIGGGRTKFQPVYVGDVAGAIAKVAAGEARMGLTYELGGPEVQTFRQLLDRMQRWIGRKKWYLPIPFPIAKALALLTIPLPNALRPLTVDQVSMLQSDNVVSEQAKLEGRNLEGLGLTRPHSIATIVPSYLIRFNPKGQYALYRA
jgi:NADH dehydrogenase